MVAGPAPAMRKSGDNAEVPERATRVLHRAAGFPDPRKKVFPTRNLRAPCYWCGMPLRDLACKTRDVCSASFTDHDVAVVPTSAFVCPSCTWCMTGRPPDTLRLWTVTFAPGIPCPANHPKAQDLGAEIHLQNKKNPTHTVRVLREPPAGDWVCSVADTGKIHVVPFALVNRGQGPWIVRFERENVRSDPTTFSNLHENVVALLDAGISKRSIKDGDMTVRQWRCPECRRAWQSRYPAVKRYLGRPILRLVVFLARKSGECTK